MFFNLFFSSISVVTECSTGVLLGKIQKAIEFELLLTVIHLLLAYLSFSLFYLHIVMITMLCLKR